MMRAKAGKAGAVVAHLKRACQSDLAIQISWEQRRETTCSSQEEGSGDINTG